MFFLSLYNLILTNSKSAKTSFEKKSYDDIFSSGPRHTISETLVFKPKVTNRYT